MYKTNELLDLTHTLAGKYLNKFEYPYQALSGLKDFVIELGNTLDLNEYNKVKENVWIHKTCNIFPSAYINGPCIIGKNTEVRHSAFIRESALIGEDSVIGNSCEIKNSIIFDHVEVPHFNYVGDSVLGYKAHMGAGSITSNIRSDKTLIKIHDDGNDIETNLRKLGAILGDFVEVGCNTVLNPGSVVGRNTIIYPLSFVRGVIKENSIYTNKGELIKK